jgi:protein-disulfide isomerase
MTSAKQSKRLRAARPAPPPVRSKHQRRQASPRVLLAAAAAVVLVIVAVVLGIALSNGGSATTTPAVLSGAADVQALLKGIPQHGNVLGSPSAPVTMVEYVDLQCPYCQQFETQAMTTLIPQYVRTGKVKIELRVLAFIGPDSASGRTAAFAAAKQNKLFNFAQLLYLNQGKENTGWLTDNVIKAAAADIPGVNVTQLLADRGSASVSNQAQQFDSEATADAVSSTPTILVGKSGTTPKPVTLSSLTDPTAVANAIAAALR